MITTRMAVDLAIPKARDPCLGLLNIEQPQPAFGAALDANHDTRVR